MAKNKISKENQLAFLSSQLFTLVILNSIKSSNELNSVTKELCDNALLVTSQTIDKIVTDYPKLEKEIQPIIDSFTSQEPSNV